MQQGKYKFMPWQRIFRRLVFMAMPVPLLISIGGCQYYEESRVLKATADLKHEQAKLLEAYRLCLQKYEAQPADAKERCTPYVQSIRELDIKHEK